MAAKRQLSIRAKILLVSLCFSLPILVLGYFVIINIDANSQIAQLEIVGDLYQRPVEAVIRDVGNHKVLAQHCPNGGDCSAQIAELAAAVDKDIEALRVVDQQLGSQLEFTTEGLAKRKREAATVDNLQKNWNEVKAIVAEAHGPLPGDIDDKYGNVLGSANLMITHLGDISTLILDPELDTYHFMVDTLLTFPQNQNRITTLIGLVQAAYDHGFTMADRVALSAQAAELTDMDIGEATLDTTTAFNENSNEFHGLVESFNQSIPPLFKDWTEKNTKLIELTKQLATEDKPSITLDQYIEAANLARQSSFDFWDKAIVELDNLFQIRTEYYNNRRNVSLLLSALALIFSGFIAYLVTRSMVVPLNKLALTLSPGADLLAGSVKQISEASTQGGENASTAAIICEELSAHADDMRKTALNLEVLVFGREVNRN
jgi:hypothetical protein